MLSRHGFARLPAADQLRVLLSALRIPTGLPPQATALQAKAKANNWVIGPQATVEVRNGIVHPVMDRRLQYTPQLLHDVWTLQQWYIELVLLRLFRHTGTYANRLQRPHYRGQVERVPWAD
jgi:hypothetical protein